MVRFTSAWMGWTLAGQLLLGCSGPVADMRDGVVSDAGDGSAEGVAERDGSDVQSSRDDSGVTMAGDGAAEDAAAAPLPEADGATGDSGSLTDAAAGDAGAEDAQPADASGEPASVYGLDARPQNDTCRVDRLPTLLSETGCFDAERPWVPAAGLLAYTVNHPLWSDGADKRRWLALPEGTSLTVDATSGDIDVPVGGVLIKEFSLAGRRVETRFLVRQNADKWTVGSYVWDAAGSDATLGSGGVDVDGFLWDVPSNGACNKCHTQGAGGSLGLEQMQLDGPMRYPSTGRTANQVDTWIHIGVLDRRVGVRALPGLDAAASAESRARAYLHVNCSGCHRPSETGRFDARWTTPFADQGLCDVAPQANDFGSVDNRLLAPGAPLQSIVRLRLSTPELSQRMPPVGTVVVNDDAVKTFDAWISRMTGCP